MAYSRPDVQDTVRPRVAPIPSVDDQAASAGPRYVHTEPMPGPVPGAGHTWAAAPSMPAGFVPFLPRRKSVVFAGLLGLVFGPLGLLYSTLLGAFLFTLPAALVVVFTAGHAAPAVCLLSALWGMWAVAGHNARVARAEAAAQAAVWRRG